MLDRIRRSLPETPDMLLLMSKRVVPMRSGMFQVHRTGVQFVR